MHATKWHSLWSVRAPPAPCLPVSSPQWLHLRLFVLLARRFSCCFCYLCCLCCCHATLATATSSRSRQHAKLSAPTARRERAVCGGGRCQRSWRRVKGQLALSPVRRLSCHVHFNFHMLWHVCNATLKLPTQPTRYCCCPCSCSCLCSCLCSCTSSCSICLCILQLLLPFFTPQRTRFMQHSTATAASACSCSKKANSSYLPGLQKN